jgi:hypothetical protein
VNEPLPLMYGDLADWFHLVTAPAEYAEESAFYLRTLTEALGEQPRSLLELGSGGGNNASHYKHSLQTVVLTDLSEGMLNMSRQINPDCEHMQGDMRTLRLEREFDLVFVQDAINYLTTEDDLRRGLRTAFVHCRPGGAALFAPDTVRELFQEESDHGGNDGYGRALRYLEWTYDPDPADSVYTVDYVYLLHEDGQPTRALYDRHVCGLFSRADWLRLLREAGFEEARALPFEHSEEPSGSLEVFVARRLRR